MRHRTEQEEMMAQYLLGKLPSQEASRVEEQFFTDGQFFEQLLAVEDALIDAYVEGKLSAEERKSFEESLMSSPQQLRQIGFTIDLISDLSNMRAARNEGAKSKGKTSPPRWQSFFPPASVTLLWHRYSFIIFLPVLATCVYLLISNAGMRTRVNQLEQERATLEDRRRELEQIMRDGGNVPDRSSGVMASILLSNTILPRGGGKIASVYIPAGASKLQIKIELEDKTSYKGSYVVAIETVRGIGVWKQEIPTSAQVEPGKLTFSVPAENLEDEVYTLKLNLRAEDGKLVGISEYPFRVKR